MKYRPWAADYKPPAPPDENSNVKKTPEEIEREIKVSDLFFWLEIYVMFLIKLKSIKLLQSCKEINILFYHLDIFQGLISPFSIGSLSEVHWENRKWTYFKGWNIILRIPGLCFILFFIHIQRRLKINKIFASNCQCLQMDWEQETSMIISPSIYLITLSLI